MKFRNTSTTAIHSILVRYELKLNNLTVLVYYDNYCTTIHEYC